MVIIQDWAGNICFNDAQFESFDDADDFLSTVLINYDEERGEYYITQISEV